MSVETEKWYCFPAINLAYRFFYVPDRYGGPPQRRVQFKDINEIDIRDCHPPEVSANSKIGDASRLTQNGAN